MVYPEESLKIVKLIASVLFALPLGIVVPCHITVCVTPEKLRLFILYGVDPCLIIITIVVVLFTEILETLSKDEYCDVRYTVAKNSNTPTKVLEMLSKDEDYDVRCAVTENQNIPIVEKKNEKN